MNTQRLLSSSCLTTSKVPTIPGICGNFHIIVHVQTDSNTVYRLYMFVLYIISGKFSHNCSVLLFPHCAHKSKYRIFPNPIYNDKIKFMYLCSIYLDVSIFACWIWQRRSRQVPAILVFLQKVKRHFYLILNKKIITFLFVSFTCVLFTYAVYISTQWKHGIMSPSIQEAIQ
jgi:hypothetical protein